MFSDDDMCLVMESDERFPSDAEDQNTEKQENSMKKVSGSLSKIKRKTFKGIKPPSLEIADIMAAKRQFDLNTQVITAKTKKDLAEKKEIEHLKAKIQEKDMLIHRLQLENKEIPGLKREIQHLQNHINSLRQINSNSTVSQVQKVPLKSRLGKIDMKARIGDVQGSSFLEEVEKRRQQTQIERKAGPATSYQKQSSEGVLVRKGLHLSMVRFPAIDKEDQEERHNDHNTLPEELVLTEFSENGPIPAKKRKI